MKELKELAEYLTKYAKALSSGAEKFAQALPYFTRQHIDRQAAKKLNTTKEQYMSAVKANMSNYVLVVELDPENWIANAVESGIGSFSMKATHLKSPKARRSKEGYRYLRVPISKQKGAKPGPSEKSKELQERINEILAGPKFGISKLKVQLDGSVYERQAVTGAGQNIKGFYRVRKFDSIQDYHSGKKKPKWQYILFRTISEKPTAIGVWQHPGITPVNIFRETEIWLKNNAEALLESFIDSELEAILGGGAQ